MHIQSIFSIPGNRRLCFLLLALASMTISSDAQNTTFSGTYTLVFGGPTEYSIQQNMFGQEVGFCPGGAPPQLPFGYSCTNQNGQNVLTGTLVADGNGNITTGSSYVFTNDISSNTCSSKHNAAPDCPYKVPSGIAWSSTVSYVVGDEVDFTVGGNLLTFQAVTNNTDVPPNTSTCTSNVGVPPNCDWDQLYVSATGKSNSKGSWTGTYTVQSNGSGLLQLTPAGQKTLSLSIVVPTAPLAIGQEVPLVGLPSLTNEIEGSGSAVRVK